MATIVTVTFNARNVSWLCQPHGLKLAKSGVFLESHFLGDEVDVEKFVTMVKEELADSDVTVRVFKEV